MSTEEKTEEPTPKRREEAREEGQVARSQDLSMAFTLLFSFLLMFFLMEGILRDNIYLMRKFFTDYMTWELTPQNFNSILMEVVVFGIRLIFPIMLIIMVIGVALGIVQVGFLFTPKVIQPELSKLNPISGLKRIFSLRTLVELVKSLLKVSIVGVVAYLTIRAEMESILLLGTMGLGGALQFLGRLIFNVAVRVSLVLIILGIADFAYQKWQHEQDLKMTKQEVKEERKQREGHPEVKKRIKREQQKMAQMRMMEDVPEADVVITNPVHIAVAVKFDIETMEAPIVVAKGKNEVAERIKAKAEEFEIEIVEEKALARALYGSVEIGEEIPTELYQAVAEILAYVYQLNDEGGY
ncbi:flagellar biosynthesis protein FlhB [Fuchsiella alkaliacetigena]|uniref:flagellar biosynthesis protein FlhB n=1 Tax=Fuchsiella alkaliacetigena TaxID=957042 RepID=UPI00200ABDD4|nr:flagellar biosynthesis protein FlhB [Fuchsiella alkaliacetigena]MCK8823534.1 flagellar biosynthesis protein FlhB [Fuchsiella alkaliacetigena]